jgi:pilus assembly protein CpaB
MNTARIVVLTIALSAGGVAAFPASGSDNKPPATRPVTQLQTVDVLVAKSDIGLGQTVTREHLQWQSWPATTASNSFIRRNECPDASEAGRKHQPGPLPDLTLNDDTEVTEGRPT